MEEETKNKVKADKEWVGNSKVVVICLYYGSLKDSLHSGVNYELVTLVQHTQTVKYEYGRASMKK